MQIGKYGSMQINKYAASMQVSKYVGTYVCKYANMQAFKNENKQVCIYASI